MIIKLKEIYEWCRSHSFSNYLSTTNIFASCEIGYISWFLIQHVQLKDVSAWYFFHLQTIQGVYFIPFTTFKSNRIEEVKSSLKRLKMSLYNAQLKENLIIMVYCSIAFLAIIIFCLICLCCYNSCVSSFNEDCDEEGRSWSTEVRNHNRKIRKKKKRSKTKDPNFENFRARRQSTFITV